MVNKPYNPINHEEMGLCLSLQPQIYTCQIEMDEEELIENENGWLEEKLWSDCTVCMHSIYMSRFYVYRTKSALTIDKRKLSRNWNNLWYYCLIMMNLWYIVLGTDNLILLILINVIQFKRIISHCITPPSYKFVVKVLPNPMGYTLCIWSRKV